MTAGASAQHQAEELRRQAAAMQAKAERLAADAQRFERGADGERRLAALLEQLEADGYWCLSDLGVPGQRINIDHVLVGPGGVFVIDAKDWSGDLAASESGLRQNGSSRSKQVTGVLDQREVVARLVANAGLGGIAPVQAVIAFVGTGRIGPGGYVDSVCVIDDCDVLAYVRQFPVRLDQAQAHSILTAVSQQLAPRTAVVEHAGDTGASIPPNEPILFLNAWNRFGNRRIYVKDENGTEGGYLDLVKGEAVGASPFAESVLAQMLPIYAAAGGDGVNESDRGAIGRFLTRLLGRPERPELPPLVVGRYWRGGGVERLYVHFLHSTGETIDLGWAELAGVRRVHADLEGWEPVIRYCADRYTVAENRRKAEGS